MSGQPNRLRTLNDAPHRPRWRASDGLTLVCDEQPPLLDDAEVEPSPPAEPVTDDQLLAMAPEELVMLRDRIDEMVRARDREPRPLPPDIRRIVRAAADAGNITMAELMCTGRRMQYAAPRMRAMASVGALRTEDGKKRFSPSRIGYYFRRDRTTVNHAIETIPDSELIRP